MGPTVPSGPSTQLCPPPDPFPQETLSLFPWPGSGDLPADKGPPQACRHPFTGPRSPPQEATWWTQETRAFGPCDPMELRRYPKR